MPNKKCIVKIGETVIRIKNLCEVKTQELARLKGLANGVFLVSS